MPILIHLLRRTRPGAPAPIRRPAVGNRVGDSDSHETVPVRVDDGKEVRGRATAHRLGRASDTAEGLHATPFISTVRSRAGLAGKVSVASGRPRRTDVLIAAADACPGEIRPP